MSEHWFVPKTHGYGAYPSHWKGWAIVIAYGIGITVFSVWMLLPDAAGEITGAALAAWAGLLALVTAGFIWFCRHKTDGEWRWRWGEK